MAKKPTKAASRKVKTTIADEERSKAEITISEAAKRGYASRATLQRAIKNGKLSVAKEDKGFKYIQIAELERVYGATGVSSQASATPKSASKNSDLMAELAVAQKELEMLREQNEEYREREKRLMDTVDAQQRMLTDQSEKSKGGFFSKLFGG